MAERKTPEKRDRRDMEQKEQSKDPPIAIEEPVEPGDPDAQPI